MTLRELLIIELLRNNETWDDIEVLDISFIDNYITGTFDYSQHHANEYPFDSENPDVPISTLTQDEILGLEFYHKYGTPVFAFLRAWTKNYVYFPHEYDGWDSIESVLRNPPEKEID